MRLREAAKGKYSRYHGSYRIGFINSDGSPDETEFDNVKSLTELEELWTGFCSENGFSTSVKYVERS